mmetsp:Transcript_2320/g.4454  ORF Transcript_2320/g.4454 Transcript_2320/m.4454 type:complete len:401 (+) Transcript_2320:55-1257(+)
MNRVVPKELKQAAVDEIGDDSDSAEYERLTGNTRRKKPTHGREGATGAKTAAAASASSSSSSSGRINSNEGKDPGCCTCLICCFGCMTLCGCRDWICRKMVFFPPPPQYEVQVELQERGSQKQPTKRHVMYVRDETGRLCDPYHDKNFHIYSLPTKRGQRICSMHIIHPGASVTFLVSHGNATDLGLLRNHLIEFSKVLQVSVYAYDYTGYGLSTNHGRPTVSDCLCDISCAYKHLTRVLGVKSSQVVLYGQSLGTGPTLELARSASPPVLGVVVHSGIMSGLRVIRPFMKSTYWFDIFPNVDIIGESKAPVFVIHGTDDQEIDIHHGKRLYASSNTTAEPWWVDGGGHNDIEFDTRRQYFRKLERFLQFLSKGSYGPSSHSTITCQPENDEEKTVLRTP